MFSRGIFFSDVSEETEGNYVVIRSDDYTVIEKEIEAEGFGYLNIFGRQFTSTGCEFVLLTLRDGCQRDVVETDAFEFKYIVHGSCTYQIGEDLVDLGPGDSLFFLTGAFHMFPSIPQGPTASCWWCIFSRNKIAAGSSRVRENHGRDSLKFRCRQSGCRTEA